MTVGQANGRTTLLIRLPRGLMGRVLEVDLTSGTARSRALDARLAQYYESLGWDERGVPSAAVIEELGLGAVLGADEFECMAGVSLTGAGAVGLERMA